MTPLRILATGKALPPIRLTAEELDHQLNKPSGYTFKRSGVTLRYTTPDTMLQSTLGAQALQNALSRANLRKSDIDLLIGACGVAEQALPGTAAAIARELQLPAGVPAIDVGTSCLSFVTALQVAAGFLQGTAFKRIAIVSSDLASRGVDWDDPEASLIFGDGAAAAIIDAGTGVQGIRAFNIQTYTEGFHHCEIRAGGSRCNPRVGVTPKDSLFAMDGKAVFKLASRVVPPFLDELLLRANTTLSSISTVIPHQASHLGLAHLTKRLALPEERVINIYPTHGNQVAASLPTALHEAYVTGRVASGDKVLLLGTAAGMTVAGMVLDV